MQLPEHEDKRAMRLSSGRGREGRESVIARCQGRAKRKSSPGTEVGQRGEIGFHKGTWVMLIKPRPGAGNP